MTNPITRPMLASKLEDVDKLVYPVLVTPKLDGIRMLRLDDGALSRKFKFIPNKYIRSEIERICPIGIDGEIFGGENFQECSGNTMRHSGEPDFKLYVFDYVKNSLTKTYEERMKDLEALELTDPRIIKLLPTKVNNKEELLAFEAKSLAEGFEGVIGRNASSPYKCGRATWKSQWLWKMKQFSDSEALIVGFEEQMTNNNVKINNLLGLSERSTKQENYVGANTLGTILAEDIYTKVKLIKNTTPPNIDLNKLFSTINSAGVQLEQTDIVKANLLRNIDDKVMFSK